MCAMSCTGLNLTVSFAHGNMFHEDSATVSRPVPSYAARKEEYAMPEVVHMISCAIMDCAGGGARSTLQQ